MKKSTKIALLTAAVLIAAGLVISAASLIKIGKDFTKINTMKYETKTYDITEHFSDIRVNEISGDLKLMKSSDGSCRAVCRDSDKIFHAVGVDNGTLVIEQRDGRKWYEHIGIFLFSEDLGIDVYLPDAEYERLKVKTVSGDVEIGKELSFGDAEIVTTSGDVNGIFSATGRVSVSAVSGDADIGGFDCLETEISTTSGDIEVSGIKCNSFKARTTSGEVDISGSECRSLRVNTTSGDADFYDVIVSDTFSAESVSGEITLERCDGGSLWLKTVSGDVEGLLLSEKIFYTDTTSGDVNVPRTASGGKCEIETTSGDIRFQIVN